jgi:hypothetical protein
LEQRTKKAVEEPGGQFSNRALMIGQSFRFVKGHMDGTPRPLLAETQRKSRTDAGWGDASARLNKKMSVLESTLQLGRRQQKADSPRGTVASWPNAKPASTQLHNCGRASLEIVEVSSENRTGIEGRPAAAQVRRVDQDSTNTPVTMVGDTRRTNDGSSHSARISPSDSRI